MSKSVYSSIGRRKGSIARVYLNPGQGNIVINGREFSNYISRKSLAIVVTQPLDLLNQRNAYDISVNVKGGGLSGQAGAIRLGKELGPGKTIVTILCDKSDKYNSKLFNKKFLQEKGLPYPNWI